MEVVGAFTVEGYFGGGFGGNLYKYFCKCAAQKHLPSKVSEKFCRCGTGLCLEISIFALLSSVVEEDSSLFHHRQPSGQDFFLFRKFFAGVHEFKQTCWRGKLHRGKLAGLLTSSPFRSEEASPRVEIIVGLVGGHQCLPGGTFAFTHPTSTDCSCRGGLASGTSLPGARAG